MSFLSPGFFLFFPLVTLVWFLLPGTARRLWLLCASWWFLLCAGPEHLFSLIAATTLTYCGAQLLDKAEGRRRKLALAALLTVLFGALFLVKYLAFALDLLERVLTTTGLAFSSPALDLLLPAGLSFYLFMAAGYLIDVYRGRGVLPGPGPFSLLLPLPSLRPHRPGRRPPSPIPAARPLLLGAPAPGPAALSVGGLQKAGHR